MVTVALALLLAQTGSDPKLDAKFLLPAHYPAGSPVEDPNALGGHGTSTNLPVTIARDELKGRGLTAFLAESKQGVALFLGNDLESSWIPAADGNILGYLEAKNAKGVWKPIQYHMWYWCGNSYHRVQIPAHRQLNWFAPIQHGSLKTKVRWRLNREEGDIVSNEVTFYMAPERFSLPSALVKEHVIELGGRFPILKPKEK